MKKYRIGIWLFVFVCFAEVWKLDPTIRAVDPMPHEKEEWLALGFPQEAFKVAYNAIYTHREWNMLDIPPLNEQVARALYYQMKLLKINASPGEIFPVGTLDLTREDLEETIALLLSDPFPSQVDLHEKLKVYRLKGRDGQGRVRLTGYYTPRIEVREQRDNTYRFPLYQKPDWPIDSIPTRREIDQLGAIDSMGLEIAWSDNPIDIYLMQLQGSGVAVYPDGTKSFLGFDGTNKYRFRRIDPAMKACGVPPYRFNAPSLKEAYNSEPACIDSVLYLNPSYTFFNEQNSEPYGAGGVALTPQYSVAVDRNYIPLGSVLLVAFPNVDKRGHLIDYDYRIMVAQDVGGAIKGPGRMDVYYGSGENAEAEARRLNHDAAVWLILPSDKEKS